MKNFLNWILVSSSDSQNVSLTIKGILIQYIGVIVALLQAFGVSWSESEVMQTIEGISIAAGLAVFLFGFVRKLIKTFKK